jgi:hypothetical protein
MGLSHPSSRGDLLPSRVGIPPRVASIIWNRNFPSLLSDPSTHDAGWLRFDKISKPGTLCTVDCGMLSLCCGPESARKFVLWHMPRCSLDHNDGSTVAHSCSTGRHLATVVAHMRSSTVRTIKGTLNHRTIKALGQDWV